jgi:hypothetical protein
MATEPETEILEPGKRQPNFKRSYETSVFVELLSKLKQGETITYADLSKPVAFDVHGATPALGSARRIVQNELGYVTDAVWNVGIKRLTDHEIVEAATRGSRHLARRARAESEKLSKTDFDVLTDDARKKYAVHQSVFGAIAAISSNKAKAMIQQHIGESRALPFKETVKLFEK